MPVEPIAGVAVNVRSLGTGARPVLALHCSLAHGAAWNAMASALGAGVTLTAPDFPGHGHSADLAPGDNFHDLSTRIAAALAERIGAGQPVDVLGHSFGGTVALRLALEYPGLVRSLTLFEPVMFSAALAARAPEAAEFATAQGEFTALLAAGRRDEAAAWFHARWGDGTPLAKLPEPLRRYITDRIGLIEAATDVVEADRPGLVQPGRLEALALPVLVAGGALSPAIIAAINHALVARIPGARAITQPGAGHMLPISHAAALAPQVLAHLGLGQARAA